MHMEQQVCLNNLLQRALESLDKLGRKLADEANRVSQHNLATRRQGDSPHGRVECGEQHVLAEHTRAGQPVEKRRFTGIGIANQRHRRHLAARAVAALQVPGALDLREFARGADHPVQQHAAVGVDLALARTAEETAAAPRPLEMGPASYQAAAREGHRGQLDLEPAGMGLGARPEDFPDQGGPVDHLAAGSGFEIALLHRAEAGIDDDQRVIGLFGQFGDPVDIAAAKKGVGARLVERHRLGMDDVEPMAPTSCTASASMASALRGSGMVRTSGWITNAVLVPNRGSCVGFGRAWCPLSAQQVEKPAADARTTRASLWTPPMAASMIFAEKDGTNG